MEKTAEINFVKGLYDSYRSTADSAVIAIGTDEKRFAEVFRISINEPYPLSMRAARVVHLCAENYPFLIEPYVNEVIDAISKTKVDGVKRSFLKILTELISTNILRQKPELIDLCFNLASDLRESIAVRAYCMDLILKLSKTEPDLLNELKTIAEYELDSPSAGMRSKAAKILRR